jgi:hypothetical protein
MKPTITETELLEVNIDGITYRIPRRKFKSGRGSGFYMLAGAQVHGRKSVVQVLVKDVPDRSPAEAARAKERNQAKKRARKAFGLRTR